VNRDSLIRGSGGSGGSVGGDRGEAEEGSASFAVRRFVRFLIEPRKIDFRKSMTTMYNLEV